MSNTTQLAQILNNLIPKDGIHSTSIPQLFKVKISEPQQTLPSFYEPLICLVGQGEKECHVGEQSFSYTAGNFFMNFLPMPVTSSIKEASAEKPYLCASLCIDLIKLADMVVKVERQGIEHTNNCNNELSCVAVGDTNEDLTDAFIRLLKVSNEPLSANILADSIIDEIYFRLLTSQYGSALRQLLNQYGELQSLSKVVSYVHENMDSQIQVSDLSSLANMSKTAFFNAFKKLMHVSPNQFIKSTKLQKAHELLQQGKQATQVSYQVGYNSFSQFSREYKRFFGYPPSATVSSLAG